MVLRISIMVCSPLKARYPNAQPPAYYWSLTRAFCEARDFAVHLNPRNRVVAKNLPLGFATVGSSNVPTFRTMVSGRIADSSAIDEPHSGQKCLRIGFPLPPMLLNVLSGPSIVIASLGTRTSAAKVLPVNLWQSRQWHTVALVGSASAV